MSLKVKMMLDIWDGTGVVIVGWMTLIHELFLLIMLIIIYHSLHENRNMSIKYVKRSKIFFVLYPPRSF